MFLKSINKENIKKATGTFLMSQGWKNTLVFLSFILLASGFWGLQYFRNTFEFEIPIEVNYEHIPAGIALSGKLPKEITLRVQDKGSAYFNYMIKKKNRELFITIDMRILSLNNTSHVIDQTVLHLLIAEKLLASTQLKSYSPDKIEFNYSLLEKKELPVTVIGTISPAFGYLFSDSIRIEPDRITAYGNKNQLDTLQEIKTIPLDYNNIDKNWSVSAGIQDIEGIFLPVNSVKLFATVEEFTEKTYKLPVVCFNIPSNRRVLFFPSTVELSVSVGLSKYSQLLESNFEIAVNYNDLKQKNSANCSLSLTQKPSWLYNYRIVPDVIEFLIEQKNDR